MDRIEKALHLIDRNGLGLEIGPSHRPLAPKKAGFNVEILDHATAEELREKYQGHNLDIDNIEEVDYVWQGEPLDELVGKTGAYDYIIASHVIEHTTDLIGFLQQCSKLLKPNGVLSLIIPDKRYCFDYLRPISTSGDCIQAHFEKRSRHNVGVIFDYFSSVCSLNGVSAWDENSNQGELKFIHTFDEAAHFIEIAKDTNADYIDVHQWRFTPASFNLVLNDLQKLNLVDLYELKSFDTNGCEFHITLSKNPVAPSDRLELYKTTLRELSATNVLQPKGEQGNQLQGYLDTVVIERDCLKLSGWAANIDGQPAFDLKIIVDGCEIPLWELRRIIRKDIPNVIANASPLCGFELSVPLVLLPKSAKALSVVAKNLSSECGNILLAGSGAEINWEYVKSLQKIAPSWSKRQNASHEIALPSYESKIQLVNSVNFVAVHGIPEHGKTTLCQNLSSIDIGILHIHIDSIFAFKLLSEFDRLQFWSSEFWSQGQINIAEYIDSDSYNHELFIQYLKAELAKELHNRPDIHLVLLDGYVFKHYERIFSDLGIPSEQTISVSVSRNYLADVFDVTNGCYEEITKQIRQSIRTKCQDISVPKSTYQNLESLGIYDEKHNLTSDSETLLKYTASHLDEIVNSEDRFADIGCNAGFFCFRVAEKTNALIHGVDMSQHWLEIASHINNSILHHKNIVFFKSEAIEFLSDKANSYEIIHCSSTYHYFRDQQIDFLKSAHGALSKDGMLVLEVEIADKGGKPIVIKKSRGVDATPCAFPNRKMFLKQIKGLFKIVGEFDSVFQSGSFYNRTYFHLRAE